MEELIEIFIRLISTLFDNKPNRQPPRLPTPPGNQGAPPLPGRIQTANRVTTRPTPPVRRTTRRPPPMPVALARPILTRLAPQPTTAPPPPMAINRPAPVRATSISDPIASLSADAIRNWLSPATMKRQFLLTEILQPPLALREQGKHR